VDGDGDGEVADHAADDGELLVVFFAEDGVVGLEEVEEFEDDGADAIEVTGASGSAETFAEEGFGDGDGVVGSVEVVGGGGEEGIDAFGFGDGDVCIPGARVGGEVGGAVELKWVDEETEEDGAVGADEAAGFAKEGDVPGMEGTHGGDERGGFRPGGAEGREGGGGLDELHGGGLRV